MIYQTFPQQLTFLYSLYIDLSLIELLQFSCTFKIESLAQSQRLSLSSGDLLEQCIFCWTFERTIKYFVDHKKATLAGIANANF